MGKTYPEIDEELRRFMQAQSMFFVATAPLDASGHVNLSPKGLDTFRILGPRSIAYLDVFGSGVETIAHVRENGRIVVMFCAFQGAPKVLRLHGLGRVVEPYEAEFAALQAHFSAYEGTRAIVVVEVTRIGDSCGYGVPLLKFEAQRAALRAWCRKRGTEGLKIYRQEKNRQSIDGLPGVAEQTENAGRMRNRVVTCLALLCPAGSVIAQVANAPTTALSPLEQTLMGAEKSFVEAAKKGDVGFFKRTLTDDFSFVGVDGQLGDRQAMVDQYGDGGQNLQPYGMKVVTAGDDAAIVTYDAVVQVPPVQDQGPPPRYQHFSTVWVKQGDAWKMKFQQTTAAHWGDW